MDVAGSPYQELHVDGGAIAQTFLYPPAISLRSAMPEFRRARSAYIIRNAKLSSTPSETERRTLSIASKAIASLIASNGVGDLYRMYTTTKRDGVAYNLAFIGPDFVEPYPRPVRPVLHEQAVRLWAIEGPCGLSLAQRAPKPCKLIWALRFGPLSAARTLGFGQNGYMERLYQRPLLVSRDFRIGA